MIDIIKALRESNDIRAVDIHLAHFATSLPGDNQAAICVATALASSAVGSGDVCATLSDCTAWASAQHDLALPVNETQWREQLLSSTAVRTPLQSGAALLVLDEANRLYLARYYGHERSVAKQLHAAFSGQPPSAEPEDLKQGLDLLFPSQAGEVDWQRVAVAVALRQRFCVISGGPGTGKTRTVARLLCLLQHFSASPLRMALAAPTGKAAARLAQSIQRELPELKSFLPEATERVPTEASTLHRLLGYRGQGRYYHNRNNPLAIDLLLVDEASMLDLSMMARLLDAVPETARLIFLGDRDQLASVEAGNVLADICADGFDKASAELLQYLGEVAPLAVPHLHLSNNAASDGVTLLRRSYRFDSDSPVGALAASVNNGQWPATKELLFAEHDSLRYQSADSNAMRWITRQLVQHFRAVLACETVQAALQHLPRFQLLCALRNGPAGVVDLNALMQQQLQRAGIASAAEHFKGRPIMVTQNDHGQKLYNGDIALLWPDEHGELQAWFEDGAGGYRSVLPTRLPEHESCYAMTIHKTQGSEFTEVCILLPQTPVAILSRQLLYTGITRAREKVSICGPLAVVEHMVNTSLQRRSGLRDALNEA